MSVYILNKTKADIHYSDVIFLIYFSFLYWIFFGCVEVFNKIQLNYLSMYNLDKTLFYHKTKEMFLSSIIFIEKLNSFESDDIKYNMIQRFQK